MENSKISWTDNTLNFWIGCSHAIVPDEVSLTGKAHQSPECVKCYAEAMMDTRLNKAHWGKNGTRVKVESAIANARKWNKKAKETGDRPRVFCQSLSDTFEDFKGLYELRLELFDLIDECRHLEWLLLSKHLFDRMATGESWRGMVPEGWRGGFPDHVRLGCTGGTQETFDYRVKFLQQIPAKNFVSIEPMLEPIDLMLDHNRLDWVIIGGESRQGALPVSKFDMAWAANCLVQCRHESAIAKPAFFFKQAGSNPHYFGKPVKLGDRNGTDLNDPLIPQIIKVQEFPTN